MLIKGLIVSAALIALAPDALAGEQTGLVRRASCTVVRFYVANIRQQPQRHGPGPRARRKRRSKPPGAAWPTRRPVHRLNTPRPPRPWPPAGRGS